MQVALIAALGREMTIGCDGGMPWPRPGDLRRVKQLTLGKPIVMGRRTHESIGFPLPGRDNIVMTRQSAYTSDGCLVANSIAEVVELVEESVGIDQLMVLGGAAIYEQFLPRADRMYLTTVYHAFEGDTFFPGFSPAEWLVEHRAEFEPNDLFDWPHAYFTLRRNREKPMTVHPNAGRSPLPDLLAPLEDGELDFS